jgi:hypothetical protein
VVNEDYTISYSNHDHDDEIVMIRFNTLHKVMIYGMNVEMMVIWPTGGVMILNQGDGKSG